MPILPTVPHVSRLVTLASLLLLGSWLGCSPASSPDEETGLRLRLSGLPASAKQVRFTGRLDGRRLLPAEQPSPPSTIRVALPARTGALSLWVGARDEAGCIVASGSISADLAATDAATEPLVVSLFPTLVASGQCCRPGMLCALDLGLAQSGQANWQGIWGRDLGDIWLVGESATVVRIRDGQAQLVSNGVPGGLTMTAVVGNAESIYYGGGDGSLRTGPGVVPTEEDHLPGTVRTMSADRAGNPWALGDLCGLKHWQAGRWQSESLPGCSGLSLRGFWESPSGGKWLVATNPSTAEGYLFPPSGSAWGAPVLKGRLNGLSGTERGELWAVSQDAIYHYDSAASPDPWVKLPLPTTININSLWMISAVADDEVWAAGGCRQLVEGGTDGFRLGPDIPATCKSAYNAIWTHAGEVWLAGRSEESGATLGMVWRRFP